MVNEIVHVVNKPEFLEVSGGDVLIPINSNGAISNVSVSGQYSYMKMVIIFMSEPVMILI